MKANVEAICYKFKPLKNGTLPLMLKITKDRKRKYVSLGLSIEKRFWDFEKNRPKRNCPDRVKIERLIADKLHDYNTLIVDLTTNQKEYSAQTIVSTLHKKVSVQNISQMFDKIIADLQKSNKVGNCAVYRYCYDNLKHYTANRLDIPFADIDSNWLKGYEKWLLQKSCASTTISQLFRTFRSVFNKAIEIGATKRDYYPFDKFKVSKFDTSTKKRAITKDDIKRIIALDLSKEYPTMQLARDIFIFSYFGAGINFADLSLLKYSNIVEGRVSYMRKKTSKPISFTLTAESLKMIEKYQTEGAGGDDYVFPILDRRRHKSVQQQFDRVQKCRKNVNKWLQKIGKMVDLGNLTTYVARHTFATVLKRSGVNIAIISESLGHSDLSTTQIYLDSFESSQIDEAMKHLL